jgi:hypothetical protein
MGGTLGSINRPERVADLPPREPTMTAPEAIFHQATFGSVHAKTATLPPYFASLSLPFTNLSSLTVPPAPRWVLMAELRFGNPLTGVCLQVRKEIHLHES